MPYRFLILELLTGTHSAKVNYSLKKVICTKVNTIVTAHTDLYKFKTEVSKKVSKNGYRTPFLTKKPFATDAC